MKIFNRATEAPKAAPAPATEASPAPAPAAAAAPPAPDITAIIDSNVKEMSEKIARLASNLDSAQQERAGFEAKIEMMEDRMRKLSSLTEMISAQYNPFVGEAPSERDAPPAPEVGLASPPLAAAPAAPPMSAPTDFMAASPLSLDMAVEPPMPAPAAYAPPTPAAAPVVLQEPQGEPGIYLWSARPCFESSLLMLGWADMLLKGVGSRENLLEVANYYHNIGWIGDPARDQLLAYADGIAETDAGARPGEWRSPMALHEKSLLYVEKLRALAGRRQE